MPTSSTKPVEKRHDNVTSEESDLIEASDHPSADVGGDTAPPAPGASVEEMRSALTALVSEAVEDYIVSEAHHATIHEAMHSAGIHKNDALEAISKLVKAAGKVYDKGTKENRDNDAKAHASKTVAILADNGITPKTEKRIDEFAHALSKSRHDGSSR